MKCLYSMLLLLSLGGFGFAAVGDTRTITYNLNGGVNNPANPDSYVVVKDTSSDFYSSVISDTCKITLLEPIREGSRFLGWFKEASTGIFYDAPQKSISRCSGDQYTLTALWAPAVKEPQLSVDSCYQITSKEELYAIPKLSTFACIELQNDIVVNENLLDAEGNPDSTRNDIMYWQPFAFGGIIEGNGHTISGLYTKKQYEAGFFSKLYEGAGKPPVVRNLGIKDSYFEGTRYAGGIVGYIDQSALLVNVFSEATVVARGNAGGIAGAIISEEDWSCLCAPPPLSKPALAKPEWPTMTPSNVTQIINAYNAGRITGESSYKDGVGGIVGEAQDFILENVFNVGTISDRGDAIFGFQNLQRCFYDSSRHHVEIKNAYYAGDATAKYGGSKATANEFKDGTVLGKLQEGSYGAAWEQNIGMDPHPVLSSKVKYYLDYKLNGGTNSDKNPKYYTNDSAVILASPTKQGDTFEGWFTDNLYKERIDTIKVGTKKYYTLYAKWESEYFVTYVANGSLNFGINPLRWSADSATYTLKGLEKIGYTFDGWYADSTFKTPVKELTPDRHDDITLYAKWVANNYKITYHLNGGVNNTDNPATFNFDVITTLKEPTREGFVFVGWFDKLTYANEIKDFPQTDYFSRDFDLYAHWYPEPKKPATNESGCYIISDRNELYWFALYTSKKLDSAKVTETHPCAWQKNDIVVNESLLDGSGNWVDGIVLWQPIGVLSRGETTPVYYANNHSISGLFINDYYSQGVWEEFFWPAENKGTYPKFLNSCVNTNNGTIWSERIGRKSLRAISKGPSFGVKVAGRTLQVYGAKTGAKGNVFDMQGRVIYNRQVNATGNVAFEMRRAGNYLVQAGNQVHRINVK
ncbi:hypothetical protein B7982_08530 [Fibrobacter sp. UWB2]|uniref:InlB B-repeat-containing protein n=1 Tax=Fibrobacter sp. UWB2 TaxID=1964358 RepID=UPI000B520425|nr:InlB B-repeat-containing protein [Fibrobacter sp. UWB2]OWV22267.1 hypothetical protein B7982_08530 [Fibrobacter sp. UWB2]